MLAGASSTVEDVAVHQPWELVQQADRSDPAFAAYIDACEAYFLRQLLVYQHWPQHRYNQLGYTDEKVFPDRNA